MLSEHMGSDFEYDIQEPITSELCPEGQSAGIPACPWGIACAVAKG